MANKPIMNIVATRCKPRDEKNLISGTTRSISPMLVKFKGLRA